MADGTLTAVAQQMKPAEAFVKEETLEPPDGHADDDDKDYLFEQQKVEESTSAGPSATVTSNDDEEPPPKRARRTAAVKAAIAMDQDSDDDDDSGEPLTKIEDESEDSEGDEDDHVPAFVDVPSTSADDQPGPSGVGKDGVEAPHSNAEATSPETEEYVIEIFPAFSDPSETKRIISDIISSRTPATRKKPDSRLPFCNVCQIYYADNITYALHSIKHSNGIFECSSCPAIAKMTEEQIETHVRVHDNNPKYACSKCGAKIYSDSAALQHERIHFGSRKALACGLCPSTFLFACSLEAHERDSHGDVIDSFRRKTKLRREEDIKKKRVVKEHLPYASKPLDPVLCQYCNATFATNKAYGHHLIQLHSEDERFRCFLCKSPVKMDADAMEKHLRKHEYAQSYKCSVCGEGFCQRQDAEDHERFHEDASVNCSGCDSQFMFARCLYSHLKNVHGVQARGSKCPSCDQSHKEVVAVPVECGICGKTLQNAKALQLHERVHFGKTRFSCELCLQAYESEALLVKHMMSHGTVGYSCSAKGQNQKLTVKM